MCDPSAVQAESRSSYMEPRACCVVCRKEPRPEDAVLTCVNCGNVAHVDCAQWACNETCFAALVESERRSIEQLACLATGAVASSDEEEGDGEDIDVSTPVRKPSWAQ